MNIVLVLVSTVLISADTNAMDSSFLIRSDLALKASRNSLLNAEIIIKGSQAEKVYVVERSDQDQAQEALQQKIRKINRAEKKTPKQEAQLSALHEELNIRKLLVTDSSAVNYDKKPRGFPRYCHSNPKFPPANTGCDFALSQTKTQLFGKNFESI